METPTVGGFPVRSKIVEQGMQDLLDKVLTEAGRMSPSNKKLQL